MAKDTPSPVSAEPLKRWFEKDKANRAKLRDAHYTDGRITNWLKRGIPRAEVGKIAPMMGLSHDEYLAAAGEEVKTSHGLILQIEEAEAIKRLRSAIPDWRRYVLSLAMIDKKDTQQTLLDAMQEAVPDKRVEKFVPIAPHAAARGKAKSDPK